MFFVLLAVTVVTALLCTTIVVLLFIRPVRRIMRRVVAEEISGAWVRYLVFALYVVGVAGGAEIRRLERYLAPRSGDAEVLVLTGERWVLELYTTAVGAMAAVAWTLLVFFLFALVAYVVVRAFEAKQRDPERIAAAAGPDIPGVG